MSVDDFRSLMVTEANGNSTTMQFKTLLFGTCLIIASSAGKAKYEVHCDTAKDTLLVPMPPGSGIPNITTQDCYDNCYCGSAKKKGSSDELWCPPEKKENYVFTLDVFCGKGATIQGSPYNDAGKCYCRKK